MKLVAVLKVVENVVETGFPSSANIDFRGVSMRLATGFALSAFCRRAHRISVGGNPFGTQKPDKVAFEEVYSKDPQGRGQYG